MNVPEAPVECHGQIKTEVLEENPVPVPPCLRQIPSELAWDGDWAPAVKRLD